MPITSICDYVVFHLEKNKVQTMMNKRDHAANNMLMITSLNLILL